MNYYDVANTTELQEYKNKNLFDPWIGTSLEGYRYMNNKQKGAFGEKYVQIVMESFGHDVKPAATSTAGHDRVINGILTEIKFSVTKTNTPKRTLTEDDFTINHVAVGKDWERLIFFGVNKDPSKFRAKFMTKEQFVRALEETDFITSQQGGKKSGNDDWMISGKRLCKMMESKYMQDLTEW